MFAAWFSFGQGSSVAKFQTQLFHDRSKDGHTTDSASDDPQKSAKTPSNNRG
jgi:hypothetical protein